MKRLIGLLAAVGVILATATVATATIYVAGASADVHDVAGASADVHDVAGASADVYIEPPYFADKVAAGELPPVSQRLPDTPATVTFGSEVKPENRTVTGKHGGTLRMLMGKGKDIRMMMVYGYARLIGYDQNLKLTADLLAGFEVADGREFTFHLRPDIAGRTASPSPPPPSATTGTTSSTTKTSIHSGCRNSCWWTAKHRP